VLIWKDGTEVDLLPFGAVEDSDRKVTVSGTGYTSVHVDGFKEVYDQELPEVELEGKHRFKFCTLPGIVLLKLIAWDDRPEKRRDDIKDISDILNHFFDMHQEMIWEEHNDLFDQNDTNADGRSGLLLIAANVLGREIKKIACKSDTLFHRIEKILADNSKDVRSSKMAVIMTEYFDNSVEDNLLLLKEIYKGLKQ
jgi:predicted nucleotidyltransferase